MEYLINDVKGYWVLDSRGFPTVGARVTLKSSNIGEAMVPSGASTGAFEACELRDNLKEFCGKGVSKAVKNINNLIAPAIIGKSALCQSDIDEVMIKLDSTPNKSNLGANAILSVSLAVAKAAANALGIPLYRYLGNPFSQRLPVPMMNILNGGAHASNNIDIQEFMIMPVKAKNFGEGIRQCCEIYRALSEILRSLGKSVAVGDEGGFAPDLESDEKALELIMKAVRKAGYSEDDTKIALDIASSEWYSEGKYTLPKRGETFTSEELMNYYEKLLVQFPIISIEDPLSEDDWDGWTQITERLGKKLQLVGDDLFVTNPVRLSKGIDLRAGNAILIKLNQIGTLTETFQAIEKAHRAGYRTIISHRSGETEDTTIADIAVSVNSGQIKCGAPTRSERTAKYNRLLEIERMLSGKGKYGII